MIKIHTNFGMIQLTLDKTATPKTTENFIQYIQSGHYNNTLFHRVIPGFMIQGGGFEPGMQQKSTNKPIENEADRGSKNKRGTIAMARTADPHSATAQFFINLKDNDFLNFSSKTDNGWGYCVFGHVTEGMDVVDEISKTQTTHRRGHQDVPVEDVIIEKIEINNE